MSCTYGACLHGRAMLGLLRTCCVCAMLSRLAGTSQALVGAKRRGKVQSESRKGVWGKVQFEPRKGVGGKGAIRANRERGGGGCVMRKAERGGPRGQNTGCTHPRWLRRAPSFLVPRSATSSTSRCAPRRTATCGSGCSTC
eukprot:89007-Chlamydomonas_euryale.AAC.2